MFFFLAGIQPKTTDLDARPRLCPFCSLYQARLKRIDHYLSVFFIPLFRVKKGVPFLQCADCGSVSDKTGKAWPGPRTDASRICPHCGMPREPEFRFCPYCGRPV